MNKVLLIIEGDWNDADYVREITEMTIPQFNKIQPILVKMSQAGDYKGKCLNEYEDSDSWRIDYPNLTDEEIEIIEDYCPYGYEQSCHSLTGITVYDIGKKDVYQ